MRESDHAVILGLSGGRDSSALLHLLEAAGIRTHACHMHHGLRGEAADSDAQHCRELCQRLGISYAEIRVDIPSLVAACGKSFESVAREQRRDWLQQQACEQGSKLILLGHHADDQAETAIFRLARGSVGALGMRPILTDDHGISWLRPLLESRRSEISNYLQTRGISWCDDHTNDETEATRNKLRHQIIPQLCEVMDRDCIPIIARSARLQAEQTDALSEAISLLAINDPQGRLHLPSLRTKSPALIKAIIHHYLRAQDVSDLSERIIEESLKLLEDGNKKHRVNLSKGRILERRQGRIYIIEP